MAKKISIEIANERMVEKIGEGKFKIAHWDGTSKPVIVECLKCGEHAIFKQGSSVYTDRNVYNFDGECSYCKRRFYSEINIQNYKKQIKKLQKRISNKEYTDSGATMVAEKIKDIEFKIAREENIISEQLKKEKDYQKQSI